MEQLHNLNTNTPSRERLQIGQGVRAEFGVGGDPVEIVWGAEMEDHDVAGLTVEEVRQQLNVAWNIAPDVAINVNGTPATGSTLLRAGDNLEFVREGGEKGVA